MYLGMKGIDTCGILTMESYFELMLKDSSISSDRLINEMPIN